MLLHAALLLISLPTIAAPPLTPRLDELSDAYAALGINAVVLVGGRDGVRYERAFGRADLDTGAPLEPSTRFETEHVDELHARSARPAHAPRDAFARSPHGRQAAARRPGAAPAGPGVAQGAWRAAGVDRLLHRDSPIDTPGRNDDPANARPFDDDLDGVTLS